MSNDLVKNVENEFEPKQEMSTTAQMAISRQAQEVQGAMVVAKKFPRDEYTSYERIMKACKRKGLAEEAEYQYPRGGEKVIGPSIRLAEALAQAWGNIDYGIIELDQKNGVSEMMAYAWDLETNTRVTKIFSVPHWRDTKKGGYQLTDARDIYELTANMGVRRMRACILGVIPGDVVDDAIAQCRKTVKESFEEPLSDRLRKMTSVFKEEHSISKEQIEEYIGYSIDSFNENDYLRLRGVYKSLKDGMAKRDDFFRIDKKGELIEDRKKDTITPTATQEEMDELIKGGKK